MENTSPKNRHERRLAMLRKGRVAEKCGVVSRTVDRWASDQAYAHLEFPKPVQLGDNSVAWFEDEVDDWLLQRAKRSRS